MTRIAPLEQARVDEAERKVSAILAELEEATHSEVQDIDLQVWWKPTPPRATRPCTRAWRSPCSRAPSAGGSDSAHKRRSEPGPVLSDRRSVCRMAPASKRGP